MMRAFKLTVLLFVVITGFTAAWLTYYAKTPLNLNPNAQEITIKQGSSLRSIANQLKSQGVIKQTWSFIVLARLLHKESELQAGDYTLNKNITPYQLLLSLNHGKTTQGSITWIEGKTFRQMLEKLARNDAVKHTIQRMTDKDILRLVGANESHPEGLFFPDTFYFDRGTEDIVLLKRSYSIMKTKLEAAWNGREKGLPYKNAYQALIMASIIEKETGQAKERPMIAGVFVNRLKIGMRLQTDPTVIYGIGERYDGNIRKKDLETDTPYNTYTRSGLPPTPIAMPGLASIEAALHPARTKALYFVGRGDGSHEFSDNLMQHNRAVVKYQLKKQAKNNGKR